MKNTKKDKLKTSRGITLIALVITIIVLLILAGVTIAALSGPNGILTNASKAKIDTANANVVEAIKLVYSEYQIEQIKGTASINKPIKVASTTNVEIKGELNHQLTGTSQTFMKYLEEKGYLKSEETADAELENGRIIDTEKLLGQKQDIGNGTGTTDVYIITETEDSYQLTYYDKDSNSQVIWTNTKENTVATKTVDIKINGQPGITIEYEEGMTWGEWVVSSYNTFDIEVISDDGRMIISYNGSVYKVIDLTNSSIVFEQDKIEDLEYNFQGSVPI